MKAPENSSGALTTPRARLPVSQPALAKIKAAGGLPTVCAMILEGMTHAQIAQAIGIARCELSAWLNNDGGQQYVAAMQGSSESLLDAAQDVIARAAPGTAGVMQAKAIADIYLRRAGVRNRAYADKAPANTAAFLVDSQQQPAPNVPQFVLIVHQAPEGRLIDDDG